MRHSIHQLAAATFIAIGGLAAMPSYADVTVNAGGSYNGASLQSTNALTWSFSAHFVDTLNAMQASLQAQQPATVRQTAAYDPDLEEDVRITASVTAPISAITVSETTNQIISIATSGGITLTVPKSSGVSLGGSVSIANLQVDLASQGIYADITGNFTGAATGIAGTAGGAITTLIHFNLWNFTNVSGDLSWPGNTQLSNLSFSQLIITKGGFNHLISALRLQTTGTGALGGTADFGAMTTPVPEASSTWMLMGGLMTCAVWQARRRRTAQTDNAA